jgi:hypothetical protein
LNSKNIVEDPSEQTSNDGYKLTRIQVLQPELIEKITKMIDERIEVAQESWAKQ